jgi:DNA-directed RNA polymerase specialized sigma24 family protein
MNRETALASLTPAYAEALRLRDEGADHGAIAARLELPVEAVPNLLELAQAKLDTLLVLPAGEVERDG